MGRQESGRKPPATGKPKKRVTLEQLLRWAYGLQMVDVAVGKTLDATGWSAGTSGDGVYQLMIMGGRLDGGNRVIWADRVAVHPDAIALHRAVMELPHDEAAMAMEFGRTGQFPEPATVLPQPGPKAPTPHVEGSRMGWAEIEGHRVQYRIDLVEVTFERRAVWRAAAKGRRVLVGHKNVRHEVLVCPLDWWPDLAWYGMVVAIHERWGGIAQRLIAKLGEVGLAEHDLTTGVQ